MAKAAKRKAAAVKEPETVKLRIVLDNPSDTPAYYVNHIEIAVGSHDITLLFARLPGKPSRDELEEASETGEIVVQPEIQILVPPTLLPGFIRALGKSVDAYEALHGEIRRSDDDEA